LKELDKARSKIDKDIGKDSSKPKSSNHKGNREKLYDKRHKKTWFSDTSKFEDQDNPKWTHYDKEKSLDRCTSLTTGEI
jgi:hypothetical protein